MRAAPARQAKQNRKQAAAKQEALLLWLALLGDTWLTQGLRCSSLKVISAHCTKLHNCKGCIQGFFRVPLANRQAEGASNAFDPIIYALIVMCRCRETQRVV